MIRAFGGPGRFVEGGRRSPAINVAPLIDVMFLLLTFLLISTTFKMRPALRVDLPEAGTARPTRTDRLTIAVGREGTYYLAGDWVAQRDLAARLKDLRRRAGDRPVVLEVDRRANSGALVFALDAARAAGYKRVVLPTSPSKERDEDGRRGEP